MIFRGKRFSCYTVCFPGCDFINFEINLIFLIKWFFYMTKKSRQKCRYLENEKSFQGEIKSIVHQFSNGFQLPNILRPENGPFSVDL